MGHKRIEIAGQTFGRLTVLRFAGLDKYRCARWECECQCGVVIVTQSASLRSGRSKSCGCLKRDLCSSRFTTHGHAKYFVETPIYTIWEAMVQRCTNPNHPSWEHYGGRGIQVCERWLHSFENFLEDMGPRPEEKDNSGRALYSLDRFPNNAGNYEPGNVRWATRHEQRINQREPRRKTAC